MSYRREDSAAYALHLHENLVSRFGDDNVFLDIASINPGLDFMGVLEETLSQCDAVLVLIGPAWLTVTNSKGQRRLEDRNDLVRLEAERALAMEARLVIPVLVGGAQMPSSSDLPESLGGLSWRQALPLSDHRWSVDVGILANHLAKDDARSGSRDETNNSQIDRPSGTVTLLFSDIEGSTRMWEHSPESMARALARHDELLRSTIETSGGYVFKTVGDAFCAAFSTASDAVHAAASAQKLLFAESWPEERRLRVRMALHTGECEERQGDYFGQVVNRVARLESIAHGGQVIVSRATADVIRDRLPAGTALRDLGTHRLKDLGRPEEVFQIEIEGLAVNFPPLRSLDNPELANNLPAQLSSFVGRETEMADVRKMVSDNRLVTLTGPGGVGKTRLALQVAAAFLDGSEDGVWFVDLASVTDPGVVPSTVMSTLGLQERPGFPALSTLVDVLANQRRIVVLDNCEHLLDACATLADAIARHCPEVHILSTSREPLHIDGEHIYQVPPLALPPAHVAGRAALGDSGAMALFVERAGSQVPGFVFEDDDVPIVASICRLLDGIPLALELAAARLRSMSFSQLHDRLEHRFSLLTKGSRIAMPRHQTLRAMVDWSYDLLDESERKLFRRLSVFLGGFDLDAAEAVCTLDDLSVTEIADLLESLVDKSLVSAEPGHGIVRFAMLETLKQYGAKVLAEDTGAEAEWLRDTHAAYYVQYAEEVSQHLTGRSQEIWLSRLDEEHPNLRAAAEHLLADGQSSDEVLRLFGAPRRYWRFTVHSVADLELLDRALDLSPSNARPSLRAAALICKAYIVSSFDLASQAAVAQDAIEAARNANDRALEAEGLGVACVAARFRGRAHEGLGFGSEAITIARELEDPVLLAQCLRYYAAAVYVDDARAGDAIYREALSIAMSCGDSWEAAALEVSIGCELLREGKLKEARQQFDAALAASAKFPGIPQTVLYMIGWVELEEGNTRSAISIFEDRLRDACREGDAITSFYATLGIACCATQTEDFARAATLHGGVSAQLESCGGAWENPENEYRDRDVESLRLHLGADFDALHDAGRAMPREKIVDLALARSTVHPGDSP